MTPPARTPSATRTQADASGSWPSRIAAGLMAWLIPGAGHWVLGQRARAAALGLLLLSLFWAGMALTWTPSERGERGRPIGVSRAASPVFFLCQAGNGLSTLLAQRLWGAPRTPSNQLQAIDRGLPRHLNLGILLTSISGLLNLLAVLHVFDPRSWRDPPPQAEDVPREES